MTIAELQRVGTGTFEMDEIWARFVEDMGDRVSGPMKFRLILQPTMAAIFAIIAGFKDAKAGRPAYFWALVNDRAHRTEMLKDGWRGIGKVFVLAMVLDAAYQYIVARFVYPGEVPIVAFILAIVPYLVLRGLVNRLVRAF